MTDNKTNYPLSNLRYFNAYNTLTNKLEYSKYNFNFELYATDYSLQGKTKLEIFDDFLIRNQFNYSTQTTVLNSLKKYFTPITTEILRYHDFYGSVIHSGYFNIQGLNTFVSDTELIKNQFDLIYYSNDEIRRLQDYYYYDESNIYSKYNFDFYNYSNDYKVYGNKLIVFTDFIYRTLNLSGNILGTRSYGNPDIFKKYFIQTSDLNEYLIKYSVNSIFENSKKNVNNINYEYYAELANITGETLENIKEHYIRKGQFIQYPLRFIYPELTKYEKVINSIGVVNTGNIGAGFLYTHYNSPNLTYLITCNHLLANNNLDTFKASFEIYNYTNQIITTTAEFMIIGRDTFSDVIVGLFNPELPYNKIFNINLTEYTPLKIDINSLLTIGNEVDIVGHVGELDNRTFLSGKIMDPNYSGAFNENSNLIPGSILIDIHLNEGISGSPLFLNKDNELSLIGMISGKTGTNQQYAIALNSFILQSTISQIIENYNIYSSYYKNDIVELSFITKNSITKKWLGIESYYYDPISNNSINSVLNNLPYNGGLIINKFILGFNYIEEKYIYDTESLGKLGTLKLNGPLLNTKIYDRFISTNQYPIVIKSMSFYQGLNGTYNKYNIGKYSNQIGYYIFSYGFLPTGNFPLNDNNSTTKVGYTYDKINFEYYYYNGETWILEEELIGGNDSDWYNIYNDTNNNKYYQHKFEFPNILLSYLKSYVNNIINSTNTGQNRSSSFGGINKIIPFGRN